jgi:uncharacterized GH25 family protein
MHRFNYKNIFATVLMASALTPTVQAHEYWIEPNKFEIAPGDNIEADLRNGQNFKGNRLYFLTNGFTRFDIFDGHDFHKAKGSNGDQPALKFTTTKPGLHVLTYQSTFTSLTFKKWEKFLTYTKNQGLDKVITRHLARGLGKTNFKESYARTIKALVKVGDGTGNDKRTGLPFEFVAQDNPYRLKVDEKGHRQIVVRLFLEDKWAGNKQVLIFQNNGKITQSTGHTDNQGLITIPLNGGGKFMLSAVHMFEGDDDPATKKPEWFSYWANLIFALPGVDGLLKQSNNKP